MISEREAKKQIVEIGKRLYDKGLISATDGNLSISLGDRIVTTPSGVSKGFLKENELVVVDREGKKITGNSKPSSEIQMHLEAYRSRSDISAVVHAHPPKCLSFIIAGEDFTECAIPEVVVALGAVPVADYATPSTTALAQSITEPIKQSDCIMLDRHGSLTVGATLESAYFKLEKMEHAAEIMLYAKLLGNVRTLSNNEVDKLMALRDSTYGLKGKVMRCNLPGQNSQPKDQNNEALVKLITEKVLEKLNES